MRLGKYPGLILTNGVRHANFYKLILCERLNLELCIAYATFNNIGTKFTPYRNTVVKLGSELYYSPYNYTLYDTTSLKQSIYDEYVQYVPQLLLNDINIRYAPIDLETYKLEWFYTQNYIRTYESIIDEYINKFMNTFIDIQDSDGVYIFSEDVRRITKVALKGNHRL